MSEKVNADSGEGRDQTTQKPELTEEELRKVAGGQATGGTDSSLAHKGGKVIKT